MEGTESFWHIYFSPTFIFLASLMFVCYMIRNGTASLLSFKSVVSFFLRESARMVLLQDWCNVMRPRIEAQVFADLSTSDKLSSFVAYFLIMIRIEVCLLVVRWHEVKRNIYVVVVVVVLGLPFVNCCFLIGCRQTSSTQVTSSGSKRN